MLGVKSLSIKSNHHDAFQTFNSLLFFTPGNENTMNAISGTYRATVLHLRGGFLKRSGYMKFPAGFPETMLQNTKIAARKYGLNSQQTPCTEVTPDYSRSMVNHFGRQNA